MKKSWANSGIGLGSHIDLRISTDISNNKVKELFSSLWDIISEFENNYSRFIDTSEITNINVNSGQEVIISGELKQLLLRARDLAEFTGGVYNPFILPALQKSGYVESMVHMNVDKRSPDFSDRGVANWRALKIDGNLLKIPKNSAIDIGGVGKGYLADRLAEFLDKFDIESYCLSIGGDLRAKGANDWPIEIQSAKNREEVIGEYFSELNSFAVATSGTSRIKNGIKISHQINSSTGEALSIGNQIVTVVAAEAALADVLASAILIKGKGYAKRLYNENVIIAVCIQDEDEPEVIGDGFVIK